MVDRSVPTIVVGVDGSPTSATALRWAMRQAALTGAEVEAVTSWRYPDFYGWDPGVPMSDFAQWAGQAQREVVDEVAAETPDVTVQCTVGQGEPAQVLLDAAKGAELLVVGNRGRGGVTSVLLGSVSHHCAQYAECPVVIVREPDDRATGG